MIGWYCDVGYYEVAKGAPSNISDITFLDINVPFIFPVIAQMPTEGELNPDGAVGSDELPAFYSSVVDKYFGPDWYLLYGYPSDTYSPDEDYVNFDNDVKPYVPGWNASWPNTNEFILNRSSYQDYYNYTYFMYIPHLKRLKILSGGYPFPSSVRANLFKVEDDGTIIASSALGSFSANFNEISNNNYHKSVSIGYIYALNKPYSDYSMLFDDANYCSLVGSFEPQGTIYGYNYAITGWDRNPTSMRLLFTDGTEPDFEGGEPPKPKPPDPYGPGGTTEPGGGDGDFDNTSTPIPVPELPTLSASSTGFITLFNPTQAQLQELADYMWSDLFDINGWKKIFADPMDAILGLSIVPVDVPSSGARPITVGNISTGVNLNVATSQYVEVDCGTINVNEYWGAYLDYDPFTKAELYLPYVGTHALAVDDIMKKTLHVVYHVDIMSGACCAYVQCGDSVLYSFVGQCSCAIPITGNDWSNIVNGALSIAASIGTLVATGGASAPMVAGSIASAAVNSLKPNVEKSGSMGGMGGMLGIQTPYLILTRPRQAVASDQNVYMGYPSFITVSLGECSGYTVVDSIHLEGISATGEEIAEIERLLKEGVIL